MVNILISLWFPVSEKRTGREENGLPADWSRVRNWLFGKTVITTDEEPSADSFVSKWPQIPILQDYSVKPNETFREHFPKKQLPLKPESNIDASKLNARIESVKHKMTSHQYLRSKKAVAYLERGAPSFQTEVLPSCFVKNALCAVKHGQQVTECIATWIKDGFAAGPFDCPPVQSFRVNPIIAIVQPGKVRPVLNVSAPDGASYNSCVDEYETEKVKMASAKQFGQNLLDCGKMSVMSKMGLISAYKQVPEEIKDLRLYMRRIRGNLR